MKGLSGEFFTIHVKLIVLPKFTKISGPPMTLVKGSGVMYVCVCERGKKAALNDVRVKRLYAFLHTHNVEINWIPFGWRRWYLTFKSARISDLCVTNLSMWEKKVSSLAAIKAFQLDYTFNIHSLLSASWMLWKRISEVYEVVPTVNRFMSRCLTQLTVLFPIFFTKHWNEIVSKFV